MADEVEQPRAKVPMIDFLRTRLVHHEAKAGKIRESIAALESNPDLERLYELLRDSKG
jgi:hypothetical protein